MKKSFILCLFIFISYVSSDAQITVAGADAGNSHLNGSWVFLGNNSVTFNDGISTDAGADRYIKTGDFGQFRIYRRNNFWYVRYYYSESTSQTLVDYEILKHEYLSTSNYPPCLGVWTSLSNTGAIFSTQTQNLTITGGSCSTQTYTQNVTINTDNVQYPQLNNTSFNAIVPVKGMLTFNAERSSLYLYDGAKWQQIHGSLDDIHLTENEKVIFGNYKVSGTESSLNKLTTKELVVSDALAVNSQSTFKKSIQLAITVHTDNTDLTLTDAMQVVFLKTNNATNRTFTLPNPATNTTKGRIYEIQNYSNGATLLLGGYTVQTNGTGGAITSILPGTGIRIISNGTNWWKIN